MRRPRPTSDDVARLAGVSRTTVSFVLNNRETGFPGIIFLINPSQERLFDQ